MRCSSLVGCCLLFVSLRLFVVGCFLCVDVVVIRVWFDLSLVVWWLALMLSFAFCFLLVY